MSKGYINAQELADIRDAFLKAQSQVKRRIILCAGTGCVSSGSMKVYDAVKKELEAKGLNILVELQKKKK